MQEGEGARGRGENAFPFYFPLKRIRITARRKEAFSSWKKFKMPFRWRRGWNEGVCIAWRCHCTSDETLSIFILLFENLYIKKVPPGSDSDSIRFSSVLGVVSIQNEEVLGKGEDCWNIEYLISIGIDYLRWKSSKFRIELEFLLLKCCWNFRLSCPHII